MSVRKVQSKRGWAVDFAVVTIKPAVLAATTRTWIDGEKIPATGGCIVVANHISHLDPLLTAHFLYDHGRIPRYLAKSGLFRTRFVGTILSSAGQIPVERLSKDAYRRQKDVADAELTRLGLRKSHLELAMGSSGVQANFVELRRIASELADVESALTAAEDAWLQIEDRAP